MGSGGLLYRSLGGLFFKMLEITCLNANEKSELKIQERERRELLVSCLGGSKMRTCFPLGDWLSHLFRPARSQ